MRDAINDKLLKLEKIHTNNTGVAIMTKSLPREKLKVYRTINEMTSLST